MQTTFSDPGSNVSRTTFLEFFDRYAAADQAVAEAVGDRKGLRAEMKGAGIDMAAFDQASRDALKSGDKRDDQDRAYRQMMAWLGKPLNLNGAPNGHDTSDEPMTATPPSTLAEPARRKIHLDGFTAGRAGHSRDANTWSPGSETYRIFDEGWAEGDAERRSAQAETGPEAEPKRRGRPPRAGGRSRKRTGNGAEA
jgi:hypothetical protein